MPNRKLSSSSAKATSQVKPISPDTEWVEPMMMEGISISVNNSTSQRLSAKQAIIKAVELTLHGERIEHAVIEITIVDDKEIRRINNEYLQHDYTTDCITFPLANEVVNGEIYISIDTARVQADEYNVSLKNELMRLAVHGTLHLIGYDDKTAELRTLMNELESYYISLV
jgi:probable rRNA maturation factor